MLIVQEQISEREAIRIYVSLIFILKYSYMKGGTNFLEDFCCLEPYNLTHMAWLESHNFHMSCMPRIS